MEPRGNQPIQPATQHCCDRTNERGWYDPKTFHLLAAAFTTHCPRTEMLAVVGQDAVAALAQARACSLHDFATIKAARVASNPYGMAASETLERNVLHGSAPRSVRQARVVNDAPVAGVDPVMCVDRSRGDKVRSEWRFLAGDQSPVVCACMVSPLVHGLHVTQERDSVRLHVGVERETDRPRYQRHQGIDQFNNRAIESFRASCCDVSASLAAKEIAMKATRLVCLRVGRHIARSSGGWWE